jgi:phosphate transport system substrate-binding protein
MFSVNFSRRRFLRYFSMVVAIAVAIALTPAVATLAQARITLNGAGATFPDPLYRQYITGFTRANPGIRVNYQAIGSGAGIRQVIAGTVDFGGSDAAMKDDEIRQVGDRGIILVPTAGGAVALVYNLPGVNNLKLPKAVYPEIFNGRITRWNDAKIKAANPGINIPDLPIRPVVRADSSGTTFIFTNHLSAVNPYFKGRVGTSTAPRWTGINPLTGRGNPGVTAQVQRTKGAIGYVEFSYAKQNKLQTAQLENAKGLYIAPSLEAAEDALETVTFPENFRVFVSNPSEGYPIAGMTWMMVYKKYKDPGKAAAVKSWIKWVLTEGQKINNQLDYVRVPQKVAQRALQVVNQQVTGP